jgi:hypothetical protein
MSDLTPLLSGTSDATERLVELLVRALRSGAILISAEHTVDAPPVIYGDRTVRRELVGEVYRGTLSTADGFTITFEQRRGR